MTSYHYIMTVQHTGPGRAVSVSTHHGPYEDHGATEEQRYNDIYHAVGEREGRSCPMAVLFYRCVPNEQGGSA